MILYLPGCFAPAEKYFQKMQNNACIFRQGVLIYPSVQRTTEYPGVAKFGIALEWGSRGLEFESRHSDQGWNSRLWIPSFLFVI